MSEKGFSEAVLQLIIEKSSRDETEARNKLLAAKFYKKRNGREKENCYKFEKKGHIAKNCSAKIVCSYCKKKSHITN